MDHISAKAQMLIRATPGDVFDAFVDPDTMSKFWFTRRDGGLALGQTVHWYIGEDVNAHAIEVRVTELRRPRAIQIEWGEQDEFTEVCWQIDNAGDGSSKLTIEETGFTGTEAQIVTKALDSTKGFNQVEVALKALLEHNVHMNVVTDHV